MSDDMIERVAKAIYAEQPNYSMAREPNTAGGFSQVRRDEEFGLDRQRAYDCRRQARAAIEAMREPTEAMFVACWPLTHPWGENAPPPEERPHSFETMKREIGQCWDMMISTALQETGKL